MRGRQRLNRFFDPRSLFVEDDLGERRSRQRRQRGIVWQRGVALPIAPLAVMEVGAVADFVLGNSRQPRHQRPRFITLEFMDPCERFEQRRLQDVA